MSTPRCWHEADQLGGALRAGCRRRAILFMVFRLLELDSPQSALLLGRGV